MSTRAILAVNAGSSSLKFAIFRRNDLERFADGEVAGLGNRPRLRARVAGAEPTDHRLEIDAAAPQALDAMLDWIGIHCNNIFFDAIGHRIVHGGTRFREPVLLDPYTLAELEALDPLAPQHQPFNLACVRALQARYPDTPAVGCFDTGFHAGWDDATARLAIPRRFHDLGVRRYGFHGLSYEWLSERLTKESPGMRRVVLAHLGSGASVCALREGRSIDCSMGFCVLDGLPMSTRCGALDPGVIFHLHRRHGMDFEAIEHMLYFDSGLKGMSGANGDMRALLATAEPAALQAVAAFVHRCVREFGAMIALLGGVDALVFSGGIGAHAPSVRASICARLEHCGVTLDVQANDAGNTRVSSDASRVAVYVWPTDEECVIARHCAGVVDGVST